MPKLVPVETMPLTTAYILSLVCIAALILQIIFCQKVNFMILCRVLVYIPLFSIIIAGLNGVALALDAITMANDMSQPIILRGIMRLLGTLSVGIIITIVLAMLYAIADAVMKTRKLPS